MGKIKDAFLQMSKMKKITVIILAASFVIVTLSYIISYLFEIVWYGLIRYTFSGFYNFFDVFCNLVNNCIYCLFIGALAFAVFTGNKKNIAAVLLIKAAHKIFMNFIVAPFLILIKGMSMAEYISSLGSRFFNMFLAICETAACVLLAILFLGGFKKIAKILGFVTAGVFALLSINYIVDFVKVFSAFVKAAVAGNVRDAIYYIIGITPLNIGILLLSAGLVLLSLGIAFSAKKAKPAVEASQSEQL